MSKSLQNLLQVVATLRNPETGCPWDLAQDHHSLMPYFFEELHEFAEALESQGSAHPDTIEELADVLYQIVLHAQLLAEKGHSDFNQICELLTQKLIDRHPHVFDPTFTRFKSTEEVNQNWEKIKAYAKQKQNERQALARPTNEDSTAATPGASGSANSSQTAGVSGRSALASELPGASQLKNIPRTLPALQRAGRLGEKAAGFGFDWPEASQVLLKVEEEIQELKEAQNPTHEQEELGDLFFALAQYARKRGFNPEQILAAANEKFLDRFSRMEQWLQKRGRKLDQCSLEELEKAWTEIKIEKLD